MRYAIVIEKAADNYSAYVPDLPGCVATGSTVDEVEAEISEAIRFHIEGLEEDGLPVPSPPPSLSMSRPKPPSASGRLPRRLCEERMALS